MIHLFIAFGFKEKRIRHMYIHISMYLFAANSILSLEYHCTGEIAAILLKAQIFMERHHTVEATDLYDAASSPNKWQDDDYGIL